MNNSGINNLFNKFSFVREVQFPEVNRSCFHRLGIEHAPLSYLEIKKKLGRSQLLSDRSRFWLAEPTYPIFDYSASDLSCSFQDGIASWNKRTGSNWCLITEDVKIYYDTRYLFPLFWNSEYDFWICWNLGKISNIGEPEVLYFDFGLQRLFY